MSYVAARDGRRRRSAADRAPVVPDQLADLHGHSVGLLEVPHHMITGRRSRRRFDLDDPAEQRTAYQTVLCQAADCCEVNDLLNPGVLRRLWRSLHLPQRVREAWEARHPDLSRPSAPDDVAVDAAAVVTAARVGGDADGFRRRSRPGVAVRVRSLTGAQMIAARTASAR
jgi:hypothetical protein